MHMQASVRCAALGGRHCSTCMGGGVLVRAGAAVSGCACSRWMRCCSAGAGLCAVLVWVHHAEGAWCICQASRSMRWQCGVGAMVAIVM